MPEGSLMNPVSTPFVVVEVRPSAVWGHQVEPSFVRSELSVPVWTRSCAVPPKVMPAGRL
ncbi:hypothetical protein [Streptomyces sp. NPDC058632]|uniref:hypothetical protein n=1 Tax=Streptomyces sp. NPDC058632 TaxID=3346567 RepID=UPI003651622E